MPVTSLLIANRGEIAVRIARTAADMGIRTVAVYSEDDSLALHVRVADEAVALSGQGAAPYLDIAQVVAAARSSGCDAIHPGYGFLSENADLATACVEAGITFVGPSPEALALLGDKVRARHAATAANVPVLPGTSGRTSVDEARAFLSALPAGEQMIIKAVAGGGGRGVRVVTEESELETAYKRSQSEAKASFGDDGVYVERLVQRARHIEVQVIGDGSGAVTHLGERDCSLQRRHQKILEIAPAPGLPAGLRSRIHEAACTLAASLNYRNVGTFEFLVDALAPLSDATEFWFIEANPRLQVEHTVTEEVTGVDLVRIQLEVAGGASLSSVGLTPGVTIEPRGFAIQARVNMETMKENGTVLPGGGELSVFDVPSGPGVRVDTFGYSGFKTSPRFDSLLAKVIVHSPRDLASAKLRTLRALAEFRIAGVSSNITFLQALLEHAAFEANETYTRFIDDHTAELVASANSDRRSRHAGVTPASPAASGPARAGAAVDAKDPLAVLSYGKSATAKPAVAAVSTADTSDGTVALTAPIQGTVVSVAVSVGDQVRTGQPLVIMESMKMEHEIRVARGGTVRRITVSAGDTIWEGHALLFVEEDESLATEAAAEETYDLDEIRPDLKTVLDRRATTRDAARPGAVERRRKTGQRTARENVEELVEPGSFVEYGTLVLAAQRRRRSEEELIEKSPADGLITGVGTVNGDLFAAPASQVAVMCYDYTVFAGTQGQQNHRKTDRIIDVAEGGRMPFILFAEGGGGRPGDTDGGGGQRTFSRFAQLSGLVPMVGITSGRCFAGNASLLGCCDVIIATKGSNIGMGGPAMIEGGGLGVFSPEEIGPLEIQVPNGVVDIVAEDEIDAVAIAKKYLSYFQGTTATYEQHDQRQMRRIVPENRLRVYDIRRVIETIADVDSVLELRKAFGLAMVTSFIRIEGRPVGVVANNPTHLGGAIDSDAADKATRFMQLCDAFDIPLLFLCDTPGIMVGPEVEKTALVRHSSRMFVTGANLSVPFFTIIIRKAYGLGAIAMAAGSYKVPAFSVSWPTGEFGGMGLEGSVKLGYRNELAAIQDPDERRQKYDSMVAAAYENGKALNQASHFGIDDAIDPAESRFWLSNLLRSIRPAAPREGKKRASVDAW